MNLQKKHRTAIARLVGDTRGLAAVELALVLPILAMLLAGVVDFSRLASQRMQVRAAAQAGADYAIRRGWNESAVANSITASTDLTVSAFPTPRLVKGCLSGSEVIETTTGSCPSGVAPSTYVLSSAHASFSPLVAWPGIVMPGALEGAAFARIE